MADIIGSSLGKYDILDELGRGGFGTVYRATDTTLDRVIALKVLDPLLTRDPGFLERFRREAIDAARLEHPNIAPVYEVGEAEGRSFIAMKYLPGLSLDKLLAEGPLPVERILHILAQVASALDFAHGKRLIHRDVKPSNIIVGPHEASGDPDHATLTDFGLARATDQSMLTSLGQALGTPAYMAPEQLDVDRQSEVGPASDIYSFAVVAYEMLAGRPPFVGPTPAVMAAHLTKEPPPVSQFNADLSSGLWDVLAPGLAKTIAGRPTRAEQIVSALLNVMLRVEQERAEIEARARREAEAQAASRVRAAAAQAAAEAAARRADAELLRRKQIEAAERQTAEEEEVRRKQRERDFATQCNDVTRGHRPSKVIWLILATIGVVLIGVIGASLGRSLGGKPSPVVVEKLVTQVVQQEARVIETQVVEKVVAATPVPAPVIETQVIQQIVTATPVAVPVEKKLRINLATYPDTIDPQKSSFVNEIAHLKLIYEGLTRLDKSLQPIPGAAEKWEINRDGTEFTFHLRPDLKYSDGSPLNAKRFEFALLRNIDPTTAGEYAYITDEIQGTREWRSCDVNADAAKCAGLKAAVGVKAFHEDGGSCNVNSPYLDTACTALRLTLSKPAPYFSTVMSLWVTYPAKEEAIVEGGENWWNSSKYQIGNGPFILKNLEPPVRAHFVPNPSYWGEKPKVDLEYSYITDSTTSFEAYKNNDLDIIRVDYAEDLPVIQTDPRLSKELTTYPGTCTFAVMFHQQKEPFTDQKVRKAFAMALDRESWIKNVLTGLGSLTLTWIPPGVPGHDATEKRWGFDPEAAKKALSESRYGSAARLPPIKLTFSDSSRNRTRNEWLAAQWKNVLGVSVTLDPVEPTTYTALTKNIQTAPQASIRGWCGDYPDPQNWLSVNWKTYFGERIAYSNQDFATLVDRADVELDPVKRANLYAQAQRLLTDDAPVAFMWNNVNNFLVKPWVKGIVKTPMDSDFPGSTAGISGIDIATSMLP